LTDWIAALDREISRSKTPPVLVVHSLACQLVAHWAASAQARILGVFLVSAPDPTGEVYLTEAPSFANPPRRRLPFPSLLIASTDDRFGSLDYATESAAVWGSELIDVGALGHINANSGIGDWPEGYALFGRFRAGLA
jgi:predicted alpha/beta hydrolase family esterase